MNKASRFRVSDPIGAETGDAAACSQQVTLEVPTVRTGTPVIEEDALISIRSLVQENSCVACSIAFRLSGTTAPMDKGFGSCFGWVSLQRRSPHCIAPFPVRERYDRNGAASRTSSSGD